MHKLKETIMHVVFLIAALVSIAAVALIYIQKELEAKFDELFGDSDDDE